MTSETPLNTRSALPLVTTIPELTAPDDTICMLINAFHSLLRHAAARPLQVQTQECRPGDQQPLLRPVRRLLIGRSVGTDQLLFVCRYRFRLGGYFPYSGAYINRCHIRYIYRWI